MAKRESGEFVSIPSELRQEAQWVGWREEIRDRKPTKVPLNPRTGGLARADRRSTWVTFEQAVAFYERTPECRGVGFVFSDKDPFTGIDLDECLTDDGTLKPWAADFVSDFNSYTEITPSGKGLHIIVWGTMPARSRHSVHYEDGKIEAYDRLRYFTFTGQHWPGTPLLPGGRQEQLEAFCAKVLPPNEEVAAPQQPTQPVNLDDRELLEKMFASQHGTEIARLWKGDKDAHGGDDSSADLALCNHLAFWTDRDAARMDRLFRQSGCYREKWERADYREATIAKAIAATAEGYKPGTPREQVPAPGDEDAPLEGHPGAAAYEDERAQKFAEKAERASKGMNPGKPIHLPKLYSAAELRDRVLAEPVWAVEGFIPEGVTMLVAHSKIGKAQPLDTPVLTPIGWRRMGDLKPGDLVIGSNGRGTRVEAIHPQGTIPVYRVTFSDGSGTLASGEHLWYLETNNQRRGMGRGKLYTTEQLCELPFEKRNHQLYLPMVAPVEFLPADPLPLEPYLLGLLLGDGGLTNNVMFSTADEELVAAMAAALPPGAQLKQRGDTYDWCISGITRRQGRPINPVRLALTEMGVFGKKSEEKFIPAAYKRGSVGERLTLLQGLMDTDGSIEKARVVLTTSSARLARDVRDIAESLGGTADVAVRLAPKYRHNGEERTGKPCYRVNVRLPRDLGCPFRLTRKRRHWMETRTTENRPPVRRLAEITPIGSLPCQCITVTAPDGLYVTEHCIVTHNTFLAEDAAVAVALGGRAWGKVPVTQGKVIYLDTEGNMRRVQRRLRALLGGETDWPADLMLTHECITLDAAGFRVLDALVAAHEGLRLLVLDTLNAMRPGKGKINDLVKEDYDLIRALRDLGERNRCAIFLLHHCSLTKKDDSVNAGAGTHGLAAAASAVLTFKRTRGEHDAIMEITGNDITEEGKKHFKRDIRTGFWTLEGSGDDFMKTKVRQDIFNQLTLRGGLTPAQLAEALGREGKEREALKKTMRRMWFDQELTCDDGVYNIPTVRN